MGFRLDGRASCHEVLSRLTYRYITVLKSFHYQKILIRYRKNVLLKYYLNRHHLVKYCKSYYFIGKRLTFPAAAIDFYPTPRFFSFSQFPTIILVVRWGFPAPPPTRVSRGWYAEIRFLLYIGANLFSYLIVPWYFFPVGSEGSKQFLVASIKIEMPNRFMNSNKIL